MVDFMLAQQQISSGTSAAAVVGGFVLNLVIAVVLYIVFVIGTWKVFTKADRPGWWSIIPIWNAIVLLQITGRSGWWVLGYLVPLLNLFVHIRWAIEMAHSFGRSTWFAVGLVFLEPLFLVILGFSDSRYAGPATQAPRAMPATA
ncbi:MAG: signal peptidase I [Chloroflexi bacterium]|nr:signal peptidase I [Chloroflexota bacterium]